MTVDRRVLEFSTELNVMPQTGSWNNPTHDDFMATATAYVEDAAFRKSLFLCAAKSRRVLHEATAVWAPTMLVSTATSSDLGRLRDVNDKLELLQERTRSTSVQPSATLHSAERDEILRSYWSVIENYQMLRDYFGDQAALPSDKIVDRKLNVRR